MKSINIKILAILSILVLGSCASRYSEIEPESLPYGSMNKDKDIAMQFQYRLLSKKYASKEKNKGLKLVALKILNNSDKSYFFGEDLRLTYNDGSPVVFATTNQTYDMLKQKSGFYFLYLLLSPTKFTTSRSDQYGNMQTTNNIPIGLLIGPGISLLNFFKAKNANNSFKAELDKYELFNKEIPAGKTVYGLVGIKSTQFKELKAEIEFSDN
ncbi:hypothetical protein [Zunongwangia sp. HGR-M22]|uniref:hypothetical protein n=1 Tax=Zunongwangia sp. HGR-M22 TaxID=3015168 RepID=UPI0022DCF44D|nr:hypothetical protein [Zunongwangia sp. HGR-M22]WBL24454.1 hypothetical protein PBT91_11075 [Zunongwangia sp. HGR-M22]